MSVPKTMKALVSVDDKNVAVKDVPVPQLEEGEVLVKVDYVALNPTDWKHVDTRTPVGGIIGCDYTGVIVESADSKARTHLKPGQRVAGCVHGGKFLDKGSFAQYLKVPADLTFAVPDGLKPEEAATYGVPYFTAFHALVHSLKHGWPPAKHNGWCLIYGGSTAVGFYAIQVAKLLGYKVVATCSPKNFDLVKKYGADAVFDYRDADACVQNIVQETGGVECALDCISEGSSQTISIQTFKQGGGAKKQLNILLVPDAAAQKLRPDVKIVGTLLYTAFGKAFDFGPRGGPSIPLPALPEDRAWFAECCQKTPEYITVFGIRAPPVDLRSGLDKIPEGLDEMRKGKVSAQRIVYKI